VSLSLAPVAPLWLIAAGVLLLALPALRTRFWPQGVARIGLALALMLALLQPMTTIEERAPRADIGVLLVDDSASMALEQGRAQAAAARAVLEKAAPGLEWRTLTLRNAPRAGTELAPVLQRALAGVDPTRLAGAVVLTDGRIADAATLAGLNLPKRPVHILVTGKRDRPDLRVRVEQAAVYAPVGRVVPVRFTVEGGAPGQAVRVDWRRQDGQTGTVEAIIGQPQTLSVPVLQRGANLVVFSVPPVGQEIVTANNQALASITGMRDRLNVLLVSGAPGLSGRLWRDMLKSDPNITLVHFTILRFPTSLDPTPAREMALIPFPVEQLFEERLPQFDLIILDRFDEFDLVPDYYIAGMRDFVERGGAVLVTGGSDLARLDGLAASSLGPALPVRLTGGLSTQPFRPRVAKAGEVHPVTEGLQDVWPGGRDWGRWETLAEAEPRRGDTLLTDEAGRPLLVLAPFGKGRVATLLSGDVWRWARGVDGGGPRDELLRRLARRQGNQPAPAGQRRSDRPQRPAAGRAAGTLRRISGQRTPDCCERWLVHAARRRSCDRGDGWQSGRDERRSGRAGAVAYLRAEDRRAARLAGRRYASAAARAGGCPGRRSRLDRHGREPFRRADPCRQRARAAAAARLGAGRAGCRRCLVDRASLAPFLSLSPEAL